MAASISDFTLEIECSYKGEYYSVRDNGSLFRHSRDGKRFRKEDNRWIWGKANIKTGYLEIGANGVHRIVATAFHGPSPSKEHVADHIDTNKKNNRPENLRWVTRLENILLNPITAKRIAMVCGSVEAFLADPIKFREKFHEPNMSWMRAVSIEEAKICKERLLVWAENGNSSNVIHSLDEWIFNTSSITVFSLEKSELITSETPGSVQRNWKTSSEFPCCPQLEIDNPIRSYYMNLNTGATFSRNKYSESIVHNFAISQDGNTLWVICKAKDENALKPWMLAIITFENNMFVHNNFGSFFQEVGALKQFTLIQGKEWTGNETIDDYCI